MIQIKGISELLARLKAAPANLTAAISAELQDGAQAIAAEAKQRAPADQGILRNEIGASKTNDLSFQVFSGASYSPFLEFGTLSKVDIPAGLEEYAAQFKSGGLTGVGSSLTLKEAIFAWCSRQGIDEKLWYPIYVSIAVNGIHPQPFFFPAVDRQSPIIVKRVEDALKDAI